MSLVALQVIAAVDNAEQPVRFNHDYHLEEFGLSCVDCHLNVRTHHRASIPNIELCSDCHYDEFDNPEADKVFAFIESEQAIPWHQIHQVPDHVFFSHRRHVGIAGIDCASCHGDVTRRSRPFEEPHVELEMEWCLKCHRQEAVNRDCASCHR